MRRFVLSALAALILLGLPGVAFASAAGTAKSVDPAAEATAGGTTRTLVAGTDIFIGDVIKTGAHGQVEVLFADNTKLVVGPNSSLEIQDYLIRNNGSAGKIAVDMLSGSFRFITGNSPKSSYLINTPSGTIGVRGTAFDVDVDDQGVVHIMMYEGTSIMCVEHGDLCKQLAALCEIGEIGAGDTTIIGNAQELTGAQRELIKSYFHYAMNEASLDREFRLPHAYECLHKPPDVNVPQPPVDTTGFAPGGETDG